MFGDPSVGIAWLLSTDVLYGHPVEFTIYSRDLYHRLHERYEVLTNFVDARNVRHRWLKCLGFIRGRRAKRFVEFVSVRL